MGQQQGKAIPAPLEAILRVSITNYILSAHCQGLPSSWLTVSAHNVDVVVAIFQMGNQGMEKVLL